jgi:hypothetical protein
MYYYERLGPDRFQEFVQSLFLKDYPSLQCLPTNQPDGGRDAQELLSFKEGNSTVIQVKFVRNPSELDEKKKWVDGIIKDEEPKIRRLHAKGMTNYLLVTNVRGSAHENVGLIDHANKKMAELGLSLHGQWVWRDDLDRRLDSNWHLKWSYSDILEGDDVLKLLLFSRNGLSDAREKRTQIIKGFLAHQSLVDSRVRFKQVELQNNLIDLFTDVPIAYKSEDRKRYDFNYVQEMCGGGHIPLSDEESEVFENDWTNNNGDGKIVGCAEFLLSIQGQERFPVIVLEGAPGQGKSTIGQFICQIHRMHLLREAQALTTLPEHLVSTSRRMPIRIDLRDFASWVVKINPYSQDQIVPEQEWAISLESFIAFTIKNFGGGGSYGPDDFRSTVSESKILLVLDGLDEVADLTTRGTVVTEINYTIARLKEIAESIQIVITTRPTAFVNTRGFSRDKIPHLELLDLPRGQIFVYCEKWLTAKRLPDRDRSEIRAILKAKIEQPHLRDLARNTMQLAILLNLMHKKGVSLPDKRTALYDSYIDLFFDRESEKDDNVRKHRDLIVDIHRYLGWLLHVESEYPKIAGTSKAAGGSISSDRLLLVLRDYLAREEQDSSLVDKLFIGITERVVALVSRVGLDQAARDSRHQQDRISL